MPSSTPLTAQIAAQPPGSPQLKKLWDQLNAKVTDNLLWNFAAWQPIVQGVEHQAGCRRGAHLTAAPGS